MKPFTYVVPKPLAEAGEAAAAANTVLKGAGIDLVDRMKERLQTPERVVNLLPLRADLAGVAADATDGGSPRPPAPTLSWPLAMLCMWHSSCGRSFAPVIL